MPWDKERYPHDWDERAKARKEQAGWTCEVCGVKQGEIRWGKVKRRFYTTPYFSSRGYSITGNMKTVLSGLFSMRVLLSATPVQRSLGR